MVLRRVSAAPVRNQVVDDMNLFQKINYFADYLASNDQFKDFKGRPYMMSGFYDER